ncbi:MAG: PQQ-dependent sugar dehydrogenase [Polyangiaceae bacterium]
MGRGEHFGAMVLGLVVGLGLLGAVSGVTACSGRPPEELRARNCVLIEEGYGPTGRTPIHAEPVVTGLIVPWAMAFLPGGDWLVTERPGRVRLVRDGDLVVEPVTTLSVSDKAEAGLLGIALSPAFEKDSLFYVYATSADASPVNRVLRYRLSEDHRSAAFDRIILDGIPAAQYHDGGRIQFGPDGMLYVSTGDARDPAKAQVPGSLSGKLLRLTPEGGIPEDNPLGPKSPVYLSGLRNCQGFAFIDERFIAVMDHGPTGDLGLQGLDEVNVAVSGLNLGWPKIHGCEAGEGMLPPALTWVEAVPPAGVAMYRSDRIPGWSGSLLIGTLRSMHLHRVVPTPWDPRKVMLHEVYLPGEPPTGLGRLREVAVGRDAHLYVTTSNCDGRGHCPPEKDGIYRITSPAL